MIKKITIYILLIISAIILFFPLLYAISASFMTPKEIYAGNLLPSSIDFEAYKDVFNRIPLLHYLMVSFIMSFTVMIGQLVVSSLSAYAFVFIPFKGRNLIFFLFLGTMLIPWEATIIPNYDTIINLNWQDSFLGLIIPHLALTLGIFLLRQHFMTIPKELYEAAQIDGCSRFRFFWQMVLPLSKPILAAIGTFSFITTWNQYLWPLLVTNSNKVRTVQIGLKMLISQEEQQNNFPVIMAGIILILIPTIVILLIGHRYLRDGLAAYSEK